MYLLVAQQVKFPEAFMISSLQAYRKTGAFKSKITLVQIKFGKLNEFCLQLTTGVIQACLGGDLSNPLNGDNFIVSAARIG
jgi:hypothetical protein